MNKVYLILFFSFFCLLAAISSQDFRWYKGNTHTHTINSDGDSTPDEVVRWYKEHNYQFLVLSDHNFLTSVDGLNSIFGAQEKFLLISGEEVTDSFQGKSIHINGLNLKTVVHPQHGSSVTSTIQNNVDAIRKVGAVPHINHPNFHWSLTAEDLLQIQNNKLFEIYNGHPSVQNHGGGGLPSLEEMWDTILSNNKLIYGLAVDDAHNFKGEFSSSRSNPGRGWIAVYTYELSAIAILDAIEKGNFYASTGVSLSDIQVTDQHIKFTIQESPSFKYTTFFIGNGGKILTKSHGLNVKYKFTGKEKYVRARVVDSMGYKAWTQPVFVK